MEQPRKVLIADTDQNFGNAIAAALKEKGHESVVLNDGFRASRMVETETFSAFVLATKLTGMSGLQVASSIRARDAQQKVPMIILCEGVDKEVSKRVSTLGSAQLLTKPVTPAEVAAKVAEGLTVEKEKPMSTSSYDVRIMNAFIEATKETLTFYLDNKLALGKPNLKKSENAIGYLSAMISFTGEAVKGSMALSFQRKFLERLSVKIFPGSSGPIADDLLADMSGEMCNQVCGAVKIKFADLGLKCMIGLPKVVLGENHRLIHIVKNPVIILPVSYENDKCSIEFCMDRSTDPIEEPTEKKPDAIKGGDVLLF